MTSGNLRIENTITGGWRKGQLNFKIRNLKILKKKGERETKPSSCGFWSFISNKVQGNGGENSEIGIRAM